MKPQLQGARCVCMRACVCWPSPEIVSVYTNPISLQWEWEVLLETCLLLGPDKDADHMRTHVHTHVHAHVQSGTHETCSRRKKKTIDLHLPHRKKKNPTHQYMIFLISRFSLLNYLIWLFRQFFPSFLFFPQPMSQQQSDDITGITTVLSSGTLTYESYQ